MEPHKNRRVRNAGSQARGFEFLADETSHLPTVDRIKARVWQLGAAIHYHKLRPL
jgi:hypothetical protein